MYIYLKQRPETIANRFLLTAISSLRHIVHLHIVSITVPSPSNTGVGTAALLVTITDEDVHALAGLVAVDADGVKIGATDSCGMSRVQQQEQKQLQHHHQRQQERRRRRVRLAGAMPLESLVLIVGIRERVSWTSLRLLLMSCRRTLMRLVIGVAAARGRVNEMKEILGSRAAVEVVGGGLVEENMNEDEVDVDRNVERDARILEMLLLSQIQ